MRKLWYKINALFANALRLENTVKNAPQVGAAIVQRVLDDLIVELEENGQAQTAEFLHQERTRSAGAMSARMHPVMVGIQRLADSPIGDATARYDLNTCLSQLESYHPWLIKFGWVRELSERIMHNVAGLGGDEPRHIYSVMSAITSNYARMLHALDIRVGSETRHDELSVAVYEMLRAATQRQPQDSPEPTS